jgi:WD40 repeat protein
VLSGDGGLLAASCLDDTVRLFAADNGREIYRLPGHGRYGGRRTLAFAPDSRSFLSFGDDFYLRRWDVKTGRALLEHAIRPTGIEVPDRDADDFAIRQQRLFFLGLGHALVSPDGKTFLFDIGGAYHFFDVASGKDTRTIAHEERSNSGGGMTISPNGKYFLTSQYGRSDDKTHDVFLRDWGSGEYNKFTLPGTSAGPVAFSADGRSFAAVGTEPDEIRIFETASGRERRRISGFRGRVTSLAFLPDGRRLASGLSDSTVLIWDLTAAGTTGGPPVTTEK